MILDVTRELANYGDYLDATAPPLTMEEITIGRSGMVPAVSTPSRIVPNWVAALGTAIAVIVLIGGAAWLLGGSRGSEVVNEPRSVTTLPVEVPFPVLPAPAVEQMFDPEVALLEVERFHEAWNDGFSVSRIVALLQPDSIHRLDRNLIDIAVNGFHAKVEAQCTAAPGSDAGIANVTCHLLVEDDFYSPAQIWLQTGTVYEVTVDGIDILEGDPIWAIEPTGTALAFLEDFDAELAGPLGGMMDPFGWIWLDPTAGTPNWGDGPPLRAYSVETAHDAAVAISAATSEFLDKEGDPWERVIVIAKPAIPRPETEPRACSMPQPISEAEFENWFVDLHSEIGAIVLHTNSLGLSLVETEDFSAGWETREPISSRITLLTADLDAVEAATTDALQNVFGATYIDDEYGWHFPETLQPVTPAISHLEEISWFPAIYRDDILPEFFKMRSQGTAIGYFNGGGDGAGPCGAAKSLVLLIDTMTGSTEHLSP